MIKQAFITHMEGHKNSKGESAPYVIKSHETGEILSSHKTKEEAEKHLYKDMQGHKKSSFEPVMTDVFKEIAVWLRMQDDKDKPQLIDEVIKKFNLSENDAEQVFNDTFPNGLKFIKKASVNKKRIISNIEKVIANIQGFNVTDEFIEDLYHTIERKEDLDEIIKKYNIKDDSFLIVLVLLFEELLEQTSKK